MAESNDNGADAAARDPVARLLDEFLAARRRGEEVDVAAHSARAGERADELRDLIESAVMLEDLKSARPRGLPMHAPQVLGDYRIVAEIGRGGMGVVYEAEQMTLQRRVALKVLTQTLRSESRLTRFKREAQTAAKLHHTNIVPIFGVGAQDGVHYFVMQLIVGRALDEVIRALRGDARADRPPSRVRSGTLALSATSAAEALRAGAFAERPQSGEVGPGDAAYFRSVASLGLQVADALTYAHAQGTLHRDIKPANLILDAHGVLWVTDFGLAKVIEDETFTHTGDLVGTLQYMAPEQLSGHADERTDVHGLGLTLYELATLRPAFVADSKGELVEKVKNFEPPAPSRVRQGVPRDLDTIIRKAIAKDPSHRYAAAAELRDDLERFLQDRPIRARPVSGIESAWRWCRRNRVLASVGALAVLGLVSTAISALVGYWSTSAALTRATVANQQAQDNLSLAQSNLALAQRNLQLALQGYEDLFAAAVGPELLRAEDEDEGDVVAMEATQRISEDVERMLGKMLGTYDRLAEANRDDANARQLTARAYHRVGEIHRQLNKPAEAIASYERAVALYQELRDSGAVAPGVWMQVQNGLCRTLFESARPMRGEREDDATRRDDAAKRAHQLAEAVIAYAPADDEKLVRFERARAHDLLGQYSGARGEGPGRGRGGRREEAPAREPTSSTARPTVDAAVQHRTALALNEALRREEPGNPAYRQATARSASLLAVALRFASNEDDRVEGKRLEEQAITLLEELIAQDPRATYRVDLLNVLGRRLWWGRSPRPGRMDESILAALRRRLELLEGLVRDFPGNTRYLAPATEAGRSLERALGSAPEHAAAVRAVRRRTLELAEKFAAKEPGPYSALIIGELRCRVALDQLADEPDAALAQYRAAKQALDASNDTRLRWSRLHVRALGARELARAGQHAAARVELDEAERLLATLEDAPARPSRGHLERTIGVLVEACEALGEPARGEALRAQFPFDSNRSGRDG
jgi:serine/threonine protein kinase